MPITEMFVDVIGLIGFTGLVILFIIGPLKED